MFFTSWGCDNCLLGRQPSWAQEHEQPIVLLSSLPFQSKVSRQTHHEHWSRPTEELWRLLGALKRYCLHFLPPTNVKHHSLHTESVWSGLVLDVCWRSWQFWMSLAGMCWGMVPDGGMHSPKYIPPSKCIVFVQPFVLWGNAVAVRNLKIYHHDNLHSPTGPPWLE